MGIEQLRVELEKQASDAERQVLGEAEKKAQAILKEAKSDIAKEESRVSSEISQAATLATNKEKARNESAAQRARFESQAQVIAQAYTQAYDQIVSAKGKKREEFLAKLLEQAATEIDVATVYANEADAKSISTSAKVEVKDMDGGIICENKDGTVVVDLRFETLFEKTKKDTLAKVSQILLDN